MSRLPLTLGCLTVVFFLISLLFGPVGLWTLWQDRPDTFALILWEIRLPRAALAALVGAGLGLAGAALQGTLRNPLAEPGLIGVSPAAALGAVLALQSGFAGSFAAALPLSALIFAALSVAGLFLLAGPRSSILTLILAGVALSALAGALTSLVLNLSPNPFAAYEIMFWMMGSLADRSNLHLMMAAPLIVAGSLLLLRCGRGLDALTLGEDVAATLGFSVPRLRLMVILGVAAIVGAATAVAGAIGFVGLVVPHLLRPLVGASPSRLLPVSALGGALVVLGADIAVRLIAPDRDLKLGVLTALLGAPFFFRLIWTLRTSPEAAR